ncbi:hypothetical protein VSU19_11610 [Verrucomicrobiales bacterium BCK34]|nr:hypothetical protein [Verrucomicrobiales bacterium BCK34]
MILRPKRFDELQKLRAVLLGFCLSFGVASAHQVSSVSLVSRLDTEKKTYHLDIAMEVIPSEDQALNDEISPEDAAREFAVEYLNVLFDEEEVTPELDLSIEKTSDAETPESLQRKQVLVNLRGSFPEEAKEFLLYLDPTCPMAVIMVVIKDDKPSRRMQVVLAGEYSRPVNIQPILEGDPFPAGEGAKSDAIPAISERPEADAVPLQDPAATAKAPCPFCAGWASFFAASLLPPLLVIAILLLTLKGKAVFHQLAVLLVAQGIAIALAVWQVVPVSLSWALVVAAVGLIILSLEAVFHHVLKWWRLIVVALGGFAAGQLIATTSGFYGFFGGSEGISLSEVILFLLGVEVAFFAVGIVAAAILFFLSRKTWYRKAVIQPLATVITAYGLFLLVEPFL